MHSSPGSQAARRRPGRTESASSEGLCATCSHRILRAARNSKYGDLPVRVFAFVACLSLAAAADVASAAPVTTGTILPAEAVKAAAADSSFGKRGSFAMLVRATGKSHGHVYLNSEVDYRNPRNLSINIGIQTVKQLARQLGSPPDEFYKG